MSSTFSLRLILGLVTLVTVLTTAGLIHIPWQYTATRNVEDTIRALDRQISAQVTHEINTLFTNARSTVEAVRTVLFQRVIRTTDAAKREFLFLAHLQSHESLSWVSFGFPNGDLFAARKTADGAVQMVETIWRPEQKDAQLRIDHYEAADGDIWFQRRELGDAKLFAPELAWYKAAIGQIDETMSVWTDIHALPLDSGPGVSAAVELKLFEAPVGVVSVSVALRQISRFLDTLEVGRSGSVYVVDSDGALVAAKSNTTAGTDAGIVRLQLALQSLAENGVELANIRQVTQWRATDAAGLSYYLGASALPTQNWTVLTVIPESDFLSEISANNQRLILALGLFVVLIAVIAIVASRRVIDRPLAQILTQMRHIEAFELDRVRTVSSRISEVASLSAALTQMTQGLSGFGRYLPVELVRALVARGRADKPESRDATILYLDLQGFTRIGEQSTPEALVDLLNEFFSVVNNHILGHGGSVIQFQGDAILAAFNIPSENADHATCAVNAALAIDADLRERRFGDNIQLVARIGLNSGRVVAGTVGSAERANYTIHGDAVNLAARLENLNKQHGTRIIASADTLAGTKVTVRARALGEVTVRGKARAVAVFSLA